MVKHDSWSISESMKPMYVKINAMSRALNSVFLHNMMTSQQIQHGGRPPFWKSLYLHISATNRPNMTKFGVRVQILTQAMEMWVNFRNSQTQDGGRTPYWKSFLAITRLHIVRSRRNLEFGGLIARIQRFGDENVKFRKSNMADGRHFENRCISISQPRIVRIWRN